MLKIQLIVFGKTSKKFLSESEDFYTKRIKPFAKLEYIVLKEEKVGKGKSDEQVKNSEAEKFFTKFSEKNFLIACDVQGKNFSSPEFSQKIEKISQTNSGITFVIGGAVGLSEKILKRANQKISFSRMTFPHDFFRSMLLEQVYRAFMISGNREYHK